MATTACFSGVQNEPWIQATYTFSPDTAIRGSSTETVPGDWSGSDAPISVPVAEIRCTVIPLRSSM